MDFNKIDGNGNHKEVLHEALKFFPYSKIREEQKQLILDVYEALSNKKSILVNAPTGIGKTIGVLAPALNLSLKKKLRVFFLTSRHTHHKIVLDTVKRINKVLKQNFVVGNIVGKKNLCGFDVSTMYSSEFLEYCKILRSKNKCPFYKRIMKNNKLSDETKSTVNFLKQNPSTTEFIRSLSVEKGLCPYEVTCIIAKEAQLIIADYNHIFNPFIRETFLNKINAKLEESIIIVDEAHNLPTRLRDIMSERISENTVKLALSENENFNLSAEEKILFLKRFFDEKFKMLENKNRKSNRTNASYKQNNFNELIIANDEILNYIESKYDLDEFISELVLNGDEVREKQRKSFIGRIGSFLELVEKTTRGKDSESFVTILSLDESNKRVISYKCLDPSILSKDVFSRSYSAILMSATLTPLRMYYEVLGFENAVMKNYKNPFPKKNRLTLIIPETTTKYEFRIKEEFSKAAKILSRIIGVVPGRTALFFPSYSVMKQILDYLKTLTDREFFIEKRAMSKDEKAKLINHFLETKSGVLCGVIRASFSEGIDLPNALKGVVIVGLPLNPPTLETRKLIEYYDKRFGKGFDYGYIFPAMSRVIQGAGRCIRSENDKGVLVFLDKRYIYSFYKSCFPEDWELLLSRNYVDVIKNFFKG